MKYLLNKESSIKAIANAIRSKTGSVADLTVADMPAAINSISSGGSVHTVNIDASECSEYKFNSDSSEMGSFIEDGDQGFAEAIEYFSAGSQVNIHLTCNGSTYDATVVDVYDFDELIDLDGEYYPRVEGPCFIATVVMFGEYNNFCKSLLFSASDGNLIYGST